MSVSAPLAEVLRGGRVEFNRRYAEAQHRYPALDAQAFGDYLSGPVDQIATAIARSDSSAVAAVVDAAFELGLSLHAQRWIGPGARTAGIVETWMALAQHAPQQLAQAPLRVLAAVANALVHWWGQGGGAPWARTLLRVAARARTPEDLLRAGQVAAWRHGMAHYRDSALERLRTLDRELASLVLEVPLEQWDENMLTRLQQDRWWRPDAGSDRRAASLAGNVGEFIGYGGRFAEPPVVAQRAGQLLLQSGQERYALYADAYGAQLHAVAEAPLRAALRLPAGYSLDQGVLIGPGVRIALGDRGEITSAAADAHTLVLTHAWSHAATLIALAQA
ncbi:MAG: hypothetical protein U1F26_04050 [Lysobacterales bacterium]